MRLGETPLLALLIDKALQVSPHVIVGYPPGWEEQSRACGREGVLFVAGGATRQKTIEILLNQSQANTLLLLDVARPLMSVELIEEVAEQARVHGAAVAFSRPSIPVLLSNGEWLHGTLGRDEYLLPQSPQAFQREALEKIFDFLNARDLEFQTTHEAAVRAKVNVRLVRGEKTNIKITTPQDLLLARAIFNQMEPEK